MKKLLLSIIIIFFIYGLQAQSIFSFQCSRDTTVSCPTVCFTLHAKTCDLRQFAAGATYSVNPLTGTPGACFAPYADPGAPGNPVSLTIDDRYSAVIPLGFNFPFFGTVYNSVVVSTNGYISFDITRAGLGSHWQITADLPSTAYDAALIMGPYHDLDPSEPTSPTQQIKYDVVGTAPHRRFVFSFYKVPLFNCASLIENTHQIVLYESTGIIEVFLQSKEVCGGWNSGKGIIGLQNFAKTQGVMAPGRRATDPPWGTVNMNESWRFVPTGNTAASLLKRVELIDFAGNVIVPFSSAVVNFSGNGIIDVDFPNVCPTTDPANYIVRTVYEKFDNPAVDIIAHDTVIILREPAPFTVTATATNAVCNGGDGTISVLTPLGPTYEYSVDGINWQVSPVFNLPAGTYTVRAREGGSFCSGTTSATITEPAPISLVSSSTNTNCGNNTGSIDVTASGGTPAYQYSIDGGASYQVSNVFNNLPVGTYNNIMVKDANNCTAPLPAVVITLIDTMRLELGPDSTICFGTNITLIPQTNALTDTFKWTPAATLNFDTVRTPVATPTDTTKYYLTAKWGICTRNDSITVHVKHKPVANAGNDTTVCYKTNATLFGSASNLSGTVNFAWSPPDSLNTPNAATTIVRLDTTRQFTLTVTDNYGCNFSVTDSVIVTMQPELVAFAGNDTNAILGRQHQLLATGRNATGFVWSPAGPLNNPFIADPMAIIYNDTYFYVRITDAIGCTDEDTIFVKAYEGPTYYLPNAFTPNGDGLNDVFFPTPVGIRSTDYFRVFDRFGAVMYQTREWMSGWDGTLKGKPASSGTYVWMIKGIDVNGSVVEMKGSVILLR
ncbi:MAG: gliding motility-associated C-terminal domain-containing protein [Chitinophagaceae bacterium]|nr:gliding motility-associated C-terminal domain-containing protein [Chitinophagaceae bacterium]